MSALDQLRERGIHVDPDWPGDPQRLTEDAPVRALLTAWAHEDGGWSARVWCEDTDDDVDAVLERIDRLLEHGPEPDGWGWTSFGAWQLHLVLRELPVLD